MNNRDRKIAEAFAQKVREKAPGRTSAIILYGSRARGDGEADSDYDVMIVVEEKSLELEDSIMEVAAEWLDHYDAFVAPMLCTKRAFKKYQDVGLFRDVSREGIKL